jgi:hypothetical protein
VTVPALVLDDDDAWQAKIDLLLQHPVELVSFAFGLPDSAVVDALRKAGSTVLATVTSRAEAEAGGGPRIRRPRRPARQRRRPFRRVPARGQTGRHAAVDG